MEQSERLEAPGRLRARADLAGVEVTLPALRPRELGVYAGSGAALLGGLLLALRLLAGGELGESYGRLLGEMQVAALLTAVIVLIAALYGRLVRALGSGAVSRAVRAVSAAGMLGIGGYALFLGGWFFRDFLSRPRSFLAIEPLFVAWAMGMVVLGLVAGARLARQRPVLRLDGAGLEIRWGRRAWRWALEEIRSVEGRGREIRINGEAIGALRSLSAAEQGWLVGQVEAAVGQRRLALERQGHDLEEPARPPAALVDLARR